MKKRMLACLMCLAMVLSAAGAPVFAEGEETGYILHEFDYKISASLAVTAGGSLFSQALVLDDAIDLTTFSAYDADPAKNTLALSLDLFIAVEDAEVDALINKGDSQVEITSSGTCDKEEMNFKGKLEFQNNTWMRQVIPLSAFEQANIGSTHKKHMNPKNFNYLRIYRNGYDKVEDVGKTAFVGICKVRLVDTAKSAEAPSRDEDPIGDGSFTAAPPQWEGVTVGAQYNNDDVVVAGYNLKTYMAAHGIDPARVVDYGPIVQSLLNGLHAAGGGTLFIPAGEYHFYSELTLPIGVSIYGEWQNPDEAAKIGGTILKVYCGRSQESGTPFIKMNKDSKIANISFWYPEQTMADMRPYPPTVKTSSFTFVENVTFVNSYYAINQGPDNAFCPNMTNIYGTPLATGMDIDGVTDVGRFDEIHFAAKYWTNSGLPGAPTSEDEQQYLEEQLYYSARGIVLRRIDWSYLAHVDIRGYAEGVVFHESYYSECFNENGLRVDYAFPKGQCYDLYFEDCGIALYVMGVAQHGETVNGLVAKNCDWGVAIADYAPSAPEGYLQLINVDITALEEAIRNDGDIQLSVMSGVIREGMFVTSNGHLTVTDTQFETAAPQITLEGGTKTAVITGNRNAQGKAVEVANAGLCPMTQDNTALTVTAETALDATDVEKQIRKPASNRVAIAALDKTGATDVTDALQAQLNALASTGGTLYLPAGRYKLDSNKSITVPEGVQLLGALDFGRIGYNIGTILNVYGGCGNGDGAPTFVLSKNSGMRGVMVNYPEQYQNQTFDPYPYFIQGRGENVWVTNVSFRNGYNGIDLMTYRCDNFYVDYAAGITLKNFLQVGGAAKGGIIRNVQGNYINLLHGSEDWLGFWEPLPISNTEFEPIMRDWLRRQTVFIRVGDVDDLLMYNNFNYSANKGLEFVPESTGAADAVIFGHGIDYGSVSTDVLGAESLKFVNLQITSFVHTGEDYLPEMTNIHLGPNFTGTVDLIGVSTWAQTTSVFSVENGTLNLYGLCCITPKTPLFTVTGNGKVNAVNVCYRPVGNESAAIKGADKVTINSGIYSVDFPNSEELKSYKNMMPTVERWDAPEDAQFAPGAQMVYAESFTGYDQLKDSEKAFKVEGNVNTSTVKVQGDYMTLSFGTNSLGLGLTTDSLPLAAGTADSLYRLEARLNVASLLEGEYSRVLLTLGTDSTTRATLAEFKSDGRFAVNGTTVGAYEQGEWYRVAVEIDTRNATQKTYQVYLMDDEYNLVAKSGVNLFAAACQGADVMLDDLWFGARAAMEDSAIDNTLLLIDWLCLTRSTQTSFVAGLRGDVNGDGEVTSTDARMVLQYVVKKIKEDELDLTVADVDGNGQYTSTDARLILQYSVKKITAWPSV